MSAANFVEHEKEHNVFLAKLRNDPTFTDVVSLIESEQNVVVLVPQNITLEHVALTRQFIESHVVYLNPKRATQMASLNGICLSLSSSQTLVHVLSEPLLSDPEILSAFVNEPNSIFQAPPFQMPVEVVAEEREVPRIHLLRVGAVDIGHRTAPIYIIASPVLYAGCTWTEATIYDSQKPLPGAQPAAPAAAPVPAPAASSPASFRITRFIRDIVGVSRPAGTPAPASSASSGASTPVDAFSGVGRYEDSQSEQALLATFSLKIKDPSAAPLQMAIRSFTARMMDPASPLTGDEQGSAVQSFLAELGGQMRALPQWADAPRGELEFAEEGLEKMVMSRLHDSVFGRDPAVTARDKAFRQRAEVLAFVELAHLEVRAPVRSEAVDAAARELLSMDNYKAPRDKLICLLNCCKIIFNVLTAKSGAATGADEFLPLLIFVVLRARPPAMHSTAEYIARFRSPSKMLAQDGYYFTNLVSAVTFLEALGPHQLAIDPELWRTRIAEGEMRLGLRPAPQPQPQQPQQLQPQQPQPTQSTQLPTMPPIAAPVNPAPAAAASLASLLGLDSPIGQGRPSSLQQPLLPSAALAVPAAAAGPHTSTLSASTPSTSAPASPGLGLSAAPVVVVSEAAQLPTSPSMDFDSLRAANTDAPTPRAMALRQRLLSVSAGELCVRDIAPLLEDYRAVDAENRRLRARVLDLELRLMAAAPTPSTATPSTVTPSTAFASPAQ